jgi:isopenicillin N synthase-like dioxygenase
MGGALMGGEIPLLDLAPSLSGTVTERRALARQVDAVCRDTGYRRPNSVSISARDSLR